MQAIGAIHFGKYGEMIDRCPVTQPGNTRRAKNHLNETRQLVVESFPTATSVQNNTFALIMAHLDVVGASLAANPHARSNERLRQSVQWVSELEKERAKLLMHTQQDIASQVNSLTLLA